MAVDAVDRHRRWSVGNLRLRDRLGTDHRDSDNRPQHHQPSDNTPPHQTDTEHTEPTRTRSPRSHESPRLSTRHRLRETELEAMQSIEPCIHDDVVRNCYTTIKTVRIGCSTWYRGPRPCGTASHQGHEIQGPQRRPHRTGGSRLSDAEFGDPWIMTTYIVQYMA